MRLDSSASSGSILSTDSYRRNAEVSVIKRNGGLNERAVRQISSGSIIGKLNFEFEMKRGGDVD